MLSRIFHNSIAITTTISVKDKWIVCFQRFYGKNNEFFRNTTFEKCITYSSFINFYCFFFRNLIILIIDSIIVCNLSFYSRFYFKHYLEWCKAKENFYILIDIVRIRKTINWFKYIRLSRFFLLKIYKNKCWFITEIIPEQRSNVLSIYKKNNYIFVYSIYNQKYVQIYIRTIHGYIRSLFSVDRCYGYGECREIFFF